MPAKEKSRFDIHKAVTAKIIKAIEDGAGTWQMPWHRPGLNFSIPKNATTDQFYRGINVLSLWIDADEKHYEHQLWATYKQWQDATAIIKKDGESRGAGRIGDWPRHRHGNRAAARINPVSAASRAMGCK